MTRLTWNPIALGSSAALGSTVYGAEAEGFESRGEGDFLQGKMHEFFRTSGWQENVVHKEPIELSGDLGERKSIHRNVDFAPKTEL
jgi:hypothetical protein